MLPSTSKPLKSAGNAFARSIWRLIRLRCIYLHRKVHATSVFHWKLSWKASNFKSKSAKTGSKCGKWLPKRRPYQKLGELFVCALLSKTGN